MNGMNFKNSSPINENIDVNIVMMFIDSGLVVPGLTIPNCFNIISINIEYNIYPIKRATARAISLRDGILNIAL